ncbi:UNVERIFIED_CONTAM: BTB/POZ domain-containing protein [Sesamum calycinum]|uniref:BTB/POZ domain-containing protein n=1 Tax=Sesamum calycinum TaxID=2727403 RepID=A0AAW2PLU3_9LAMI
MTTGGGTLKKKQRVGSNNRLSSTLADLDSSLSDGTLAEGSYKPPASVAPPHILSCLSSPRAPADSTTLLLLMSFSASSLINNILSSNCRRRPPIPLRPSISPRFRYTFIRMFFADRNTLRHSSPSAGNSRMNHLPTVPTMPRKFTDTVSTALNLLPVALELLFEDCIKACVKFLEAVPWSEDEEKKILNLIPFLSDEESKELLARVSPLKSDSSEEMLHGLILSAIHNHPNMAFAKAFVAKLLRDFSSRESARRVLDKAFEKSLRVVKQSLEEYSSPDFRGDHNETEAIQRLNLHTAMTNGKHLLWLVERMIELKVADTAVKTWSEQASFTADLQRAFRDDAWRNIVPSLPAVVLRCTSRLANAVATGNILATRQVRMKLVRDWLPVLIICKDSVSLMGPNHKSLYLELEETFLRIISTLPLSDAQELLQQCLSFSTRNVDDCPHLVAAFTTWFRRANRPPQPDFYE